MRVVSMVSIRSLPKRLRAADGSSNGAASAQVVGFLRNATGGRRFANKICSSAYSATIRERRDFGAIL